MTGDCAQNIDEYLRRIVVRYSQRVSMDLQDPHYRYKKQILDNTELGWFGEQIWGVLRLVPSRGDAGEFDLKIHKVTPPSLDKTQQAHLNPSIKIAHYSLSQLTQDQIDEAAKEQEVIWGLKLVGEPLNRPQQIARELEKAQAKKVI